VKGDIYYNTGNVGIGTNVSPNAHIPVSLLHIRGTNPTLTITAQGNAGATSRIDLSSYEVGVNPPTCSLFAVDDGLYSATFIINLKTRGAITNSQFTAMSIASNGNIGIGTNNPRYTFHMMSIYDNVAKGLHIDASDVNATDKYTLTIWSYAIGPGQIGWRFRTISDATGARTAIEISYAGSVYFPNGSSSASDIRIKKDIEDINDDTALNKLLLVQPTTYNYIDVERNKGFGKVYGFIAQQIREVIPEAITIIKKQIIPNIYKSCLINNKREVYHSIPLDIPIDTDVKIRGSDYKIKGIYEDYFVIDNDIESDEAFVYGYSVDDFHTLNKDYIFTLNVCATQELHRRIEAQSLLIKSQDDRIKDLETKMERLLSGTT